MFPPKGERGLDKYWRIRPAGWTGCSETSATTWAGAWRAAQGISSTALAGTAVQANRTVAEAVEAYWTRHTRGEVRHRGRVRNKKAPARWSHGYAKDQRARLDRLTQALGDRRCGSLTFGDLARLLRKQLSYNAEHEMRTMLQTLTGWMEQAGYLLSHQHIHAQVSGYELRHDEPAPRSAVVAANQVREDVELINPAEVPSHELVHEAARLTPRPCELSGRSMWELELWVLLAAYAGIRLSELLALMADDVKVSEDGVLVAVVRQLRGRGEGPLFVPPKNRRNRVVPVTAHTPLGYPLAARLVERADQARAEQVAGTNPMGLLFLTPTGSGVWCRSNLRERY